MLQIPLGKVTDKQQNTQIVPQNGLATYMDATFSIGELQQDPKKNTRIIVLDPKQIKLKRT